MAAGMAAVALLAGCGSGDDGASAAPEADRPTADGADAATPVAGPERRILAFGDSLFAGYNVGRDESYPAQLEKSLRLRGINAVVTNAGVSGDTSAAGRQRLDFVIDNEGQTPELVILELGGNDLLRGIDPSETRENIAAMLEMLKERGIPVLLMGMRAPPNLGSDFVNRFDAIYPELAAQYDAPLVPFFLEAIYDQPRLIQADRVHPTAEGIETLVGATAEQVAGALPPAKAVR